MHFDFFNIKLHFVNYKNSSVLYNYFESFNIYLHYSITITLLTT